MTEYLVELLQEALRLHGTQAATARALGLHRSRIGQLVGPQKPSPGPHSTGLDIEALLRLAIVTRHLDPLRVLRAAGRQQATVADLLEQLRMLPSRDRRRRTRPVQAEEDLVKKAKKLSPRGYRLLMDQADYLLELEAATRRRRRRAPGGAP